MEPILIFGHKNPDTDSICSAIALAELKNLTGEQAIPCRLGDISKETEFVLKHFGIETPKLLKTVSGQISDLTHVEKEVISLNDSLKGALNTMTKEHFSSLPVVGANRELKGMIHVSDIANAYLGIDYTDLFKNYHTTYENLISVLKGEIISGNYPTGKIEGNLKGVSDLKTIKPGDVVVTTSMINGIDDLIQLGAKVIIICCNENDIIDPRPESDCAIMRVNGPLFKTIPLISQSISISSILGNEAFYSFKTEDFLHEIKAIMKESQQSNFPVVTTEGEVYGTIRSKNLINFTKKKVILVDHNERGQSVDGLQDARILQVVDHHKFANFETEEPVKINAETVGCTCTIVYDLFKDAGITPRKEIAGILLSAILSDTLLFKSPTCTEKDIKVARELANLAGLENFEKYGMDMLIAGTSLGDKTPHEILNMDMKEFTMSGLKVAVAQVNTVDVDGVLAKQGELEEVMNKLIEERNYNLFLLVITDIVKSGSMTLALGSHPSLVERGFNAKLDNNVAWLDGVVSRKKQIIPFLMAASQGI
ncbi:putative manganese-dependent inorganic diphosphatase [Cetobacterium ceti]